MKLNLAVMWAGSLIIACSILAVFFMPDLWFKLILLGSLIYIVGFVLGHNYWGSTSVESTAYASTAFESDGYGHCLRCGNSWAVKTPHWVWYGAAAMGAICEGCYDEISPEERYSYYHRLWEIWGSPPEVDLALIRQGVDDLEENPTP